ncbi:Ral GTPase-activating protein subunit beta p170 [Channa argus]|uniref:Ral GTPase-activating protein subunit beta p170 n=1 Tax=Channa argus TaxID=215402 RepID=A0A6G1PJE8_CHAAH|nr:Ral GTPase-activating protein subunit beta p170 [Channa argus]
MFNSDKDQCYYRATASYHGLLGTRLRSYLQNCNDENCITRVIRDWLSMDQSPPSGQGHVSVLSCFPPSVGRDVAIAVVKPLRAGMGNPNSHSLLYTDRQVRWTMEVLCYGLTLPLEGDTVRLCVDVYTDWLMALVFQRDCIPPPISRDPNLYIQKILQHLYSLFLPRSDQVSPVYQSLCQQVLYAVKTLAKESATMSRDTWESLLHFLLRINHAMLAPANSAAGGVAHLSMAVLLEVWLLSCCRCFPSRSLWQTCRQMLSGWRHQPAVVEQWSRVVTALTSRFLLLTFGPSFPRFKVPEEDAALIPADLEDYRVPETWFRFLHMFGNPVDLSHPADVESIPSNHKDWLPNIFFRAMRGVSTLVDAFLGVNVVNKEPTELLPNTGVAVTKSPFKDRLPSYGISRPRSGSAPPTPVNILSVPSATSTTTTPSHNSRLKPVNVSKATTKPLTILSSTHHWKSNSPPSTPSLCSSPRPSPSPLRCNVDSLLHLFGFWLFDAALIHKDSASQDGVSAMSERWGPGRAEACGTLCRIFTCKKTAEDILPVYLARFYLVLLQDLQVWEGACPSVLFSILLNSTCLFSCDLPGVNLLLPSFVSALENVLLSRELLRFKSFVSLVDLRQSSIQVLLSLLPLPLQFGSVRSEVLLDKQISGNDFTATSFLSLKPRLFSVLVGALQTETDASNTQVILGQSQILVSVYTLATYTARLNSFCLCSCHVEPGPGFSSGPGCRTHPADAAGVLWVQVVRLLTHCLTAQWKNEPAVCLSALEVLGGLAKIEVEVEEAERKGAVSSVCSHIVYQCSRPPPLHTRDLHSVIVTAFHCLNVWLTQHPTLLNYQDCLLEVLEIVELGISGNKSRQGQEERCKEDKELNPASHRVKEAAEATLSCVMQVSEGFMSVGDSPNEGALIGCSGMNDIGVKKFRYFAVDSSVILAMQEEHSGPGQALGPSLTVVIRGPSGCHTWALQLHLQPRDGRIHAQKTPIPDHHGVVQEDSGIRCGIKHQLFPENTDRVLPVKADLSIPALNEEVSEEVLQQLEHLRAALRRQRQIEAWLQVSGCPIVTTTCKPPPSVSNFQTSRLFLSNLGFLTPETLKDPGTSGVPAQLVSLDSSIPGFSEELRCLDRLSSRTCDSAFIFYVKAGQRTPAEILRNVESRCKVPSHFLDFLSSLGRPVKAGQHQKSGVSARESFPLSELLSETKTQTPKRALNVQLIFVHPLKTGLYRICYRGNTTSKVSMVVPLVSGSVVSKRSLAFLVRETVINCCHRRRLESDSAPPPYVRRRHVISDIILRYRNRSSEPAFYSALFHDL